MAVVFDPKECRNRAFRYGLLARNSYSDAAHQKFSELAKTWLMLALRLEGHRRLTEEWRDSNKEALGTGLSFSEALAEPLRLCEPRLPRRRCRGALSYEKKQKPRQSGALVQCLRGLTKGGDGWSAQSISRNSDG